jgi:CubicO group peptidase (beta-lactamase class C family)
MRQISISHDSRAALFCVFAIVMLAACGGGGGGDGGGAGVPTTPPSGSPLPPANSQELGSRDNTLFWTPAQQQFSYRNMDQIFSMRTISRTAGNPQPLYALTSAPFDFSAFRYTYQGAQFSLDDFLSRNRVAGFIVVKDGRILAERYNFGHSAASKWTSFSVAKSVTSMLVGAAVRDGFITLDDPLTQYIPQLRNTAYDGVTMRQMLQMSSGVRWNEDYDDPNSDVARYSASMRAAGTAGLIAYVTPLPRVAVPGTRFNYNTAETHLVGIALRAAVNQDLSTYLSQKIWSGFAMESDAQWVLSTDNGDELGGCCISATLRDYARLGIFAMRNGVLQNGVAVLPDGWMQQSTTPSPAASDYGYLWWLTSGGYAASGFAGQSIQVYPQQNTVIAMQSFWPADGGNDYSAHRSALSSALRAALP